VEEKWVSSDLKIIASDKYKNAEHGQPMKRLQKFASLTAASLTLTLQIPTDYKIVK